MTHLKYRPTTDSEDKGVLILLKVVEAQMASYLTCLGLENDKILKISGVLESLQPVCQHTIKTVLLMY